MHGKKEEKMTQKPVEILFSDLSAEDRERVDLTHDRRNPIDTSEFASEQLRDQVAEVTQSLTLQERAAFKWVYFRYEDPVWTLEEALEKVGVMCEADIEQIAETAYAKLRVPRR